MVEFSLIYPYASALRSLELLCTLWNLRIVSSSTSKEKAVVGMPWASFKRMFRCNPSPGALAVPEALAAFVSKINVQGTVVLDVTRTHGTKDS